MSHIILEYALAYLSREPKTYFVVSSQTAVSESSASSIDN